MPDITTGLNMKTTLYKHLIYIAAATLTVSAGLTGCLSTNGSSSGEHGQKIWEAFCAESGKEANTAFIQALDRVATELVKVIPDAELREKPWELEIFVSPFPYAFCLPGGRLAVSTGAFNFARDDAELAALTARAITHMLHGHGEKRYKEFIADGTPLPSLDELTKIYGAGDASSGIPRFSESFEIVADRDGMMLMAQAGYFPAAMPALLRKLYNIDYVNTVESIIREESPSGRFAEVDRLLSEAQKLYEAAPQKHGTGQVYDNAMRYSDPITSETPDQLLRMKDSTYEINYPSIWTVSQSNALLNLTSPGRNAQVSILDVPANDFASADALRDMLADKLPSIIHDAQINKKGFLFINRRRSPELECVFPMYGNEWRQWTVIYSRQDGKLFHIFSFYAQKDQYDSHLHAARAILDSLKPIDIPAPPTTAKTSTPNTATNEEATKIRIEVNREIELKRVMLRNKINEYDSMCLQEGLKNNLQNRRCPRCRNIIIYDKGKFRWACRRCRYVMADYGNIPLNTGKTINQEISRRKQQLDKDIKRLQEQGNERLKKIGQPPMWGANAVKLPRQTKAALPLVNIPTAAASERSERIEQTKAETAIPIGARAVHSLVKAQIEKAGYDGAEDFGANAAALLHGRELYKDIQCPNCKSTTGYDFGSYYWICPKCKKKLADLIDTPYENTTIRLYLLDRENKAVKEIKELRKQGNIQLRQLGQDPLWDENAPVKNVSDHSRRPEFKP
jgi:ribosomal protein L37AE/L43A